MESMIIGGSVAVSYGRREATSVMCVRWEMTRTRETLKDLIKKHSGKGPLPPPAVLFVLLAGCCAGVCL